MLPNEARPASLCWVSKQNFNPKSKWDSVNARRHGSIASNWPFTRSHPTETVDWTITEPCKQRYLLFSYAFSDFEMFNGCPVNKTDTPFNATRSSKQNSTAPVLVPRQAMFFFRKSMLWKNEQRGHQHSHFIPPQKTPNKTHLLFKLLFAVILIPKKITGTTLSAPN